MRYKVRAGKKNIVAVLVIVGLLVAIVPSFAHSQTEETQTEETVPGASTEAGDGTSQGKADARGNGFWFISGLLLPGVGMILPWVFSPSVPSDKLIGKSDEFVAAYRKAYIHKKKVGNFLWSLAGFGTAATVVGVIVIVDIAKSAASAGESCGDACSNSMSEACTLGLSDACSNIAAPALSCGGLGLLAPVAYPLLAAP